MSRDTEQTALQPEMSMTVNAPASSPTRPTPEDINLDNEFQSTDIYTRLQRLRDGLLDIIKFLDSQLEGSDIDEDILETLEEKLEPLLSYVSELRHYEQRRTGMTTTDE